MGPIKDRSGLESEGNRVMGAGLTTGKRMLLRGAHRASLSALGAVVVASASLALCSSPALALSQRGHVFDFAFDKAAPGELSSIAVNEANHEAYVLNTTTKAVEGFRVDTETKTAELRSKFPPVTAPGYVAVDNSRDPAEDLSAGDVYVSSTIGSKEAPKGAIYKFSADGEQLAKITKVREGKETPVALGKILGLAVGPNGTLWVDEELEGSHIVDAVSDAASKSGVAELVSPPVEVEGSAPIAAPGFAVDSTEGILYVGHGTETQEEAEEAGVALCTITPCVIAKLAVVEDSEEDLVDELVSQNTSAVAVDLFGAGTFRDDVYLDNLTSITELSSSGSLVQQFGLGGAAERGFAGLQEGRGIAVDSTTGEVFVVDARTGEVDVFELEPSGEPTVDSVSAAKVTSQSAELNAAIDPRGAETEYTFEYSPTTPVSCASVSTATCAEPVPAGKILAGFGDQPASVEVTGLRPGTEYHYRVRATNAHGTIVSEERAFTTSAQAASESVLPDGREWEMVSPPAKQGAAIEPMRKEGGAIQAAAGGEAITYVADAPTEETDGNRNPEVTQLLSIRSSSGWSSKDISTRNETAQGPPSPADGPEYSLFSSDLSLALVDPFPGPSQLAEPALSPPVVSGEPQENTVYIRNNGPPLAPEATNGNIQAQAELDGQKMSNAGYLALINHGDDRTGRPFGKSLGAEGVANATPDLSHVVFGDVEVPLSAAYPSAPSHSLYEWTEGNLPEGDIQLVSLLPDGSPSPNPYLGATPKGFLSRHAISNSGSRVFWSEEVSGTDVVLYMRDTAVGRTVDLSAVQEGEGEGVPDARYQTASTDGSKVLFTDSQRLVKESGAEESRDDLYECEIVEEASEDKCALTDRTPTYEKHGADVLGVVLGATETDLSRVYFVANGVLTSSPNAEGEQASAGNCTDVKQTQGAPPVGATCNLYVSEPDPEHAGLYKTTFIARLANEDFPDWEATFNNLSEITARVSPNGEYLAFMSERSLTDYDNTDANSGQPDEEVYLYDAGTNHLVCASCNPSGARPTGVLDTEESGEGVGLLVDRREIWRAVSADHWLAGSIPGWTASDFSRSLYQSRYLSNSGRLFFNSADALVPQDTNGKEDVYEYELPGLGGCTSSAPSFSARQGGCIALISSGTSNRESAFLDASESGGDVFFLTSASLVRQDVDTAFDVYDAHECTSASPCVQPPPAKPAPCESEESCRTASSPPPSFSAPTSTTFSGAGNVVPTQQALPFKTTVKPPTRAQLLAKALKACKKKKSRSKRIACERQAKKKYGPKQAKKAKSSKRDSGTKGSSR